MGCCKGDHKVIKLRIARLLEGFGKLAVDRIFGSAPGSLATQRGVICMFCEHRTFLNVFQWGKGFITEGDLPINHTPALGDVLWCSVCKCCIEAKIRVKDIQCPEDKWQDAK